MIAWYLLSGTSSTYIVVAIKKEPVKLEKIQMGKLLRSLVLKYYATTSS